MAQNHFSNLSQQGRYGDTELAHVNKEEQALLKSRGGSGTINPATGLKEFNPFMAATFALSLYGAAKQGSMQRTAAEMQSDTAQQGLDALNLASGSLDTSREGKKKLALAQHEKKKKDYGFSMDTTLQDVNKQINQAVSKSGMATSGTVKEKASTQHKRIAQNYTSGVEGLMGQLGEKMGEIEGWYEGEKGRISSEQKRLQLEKKFADKQANSGLFI